MKALWLVSFRPIGTSKVNDFYQSLFVDSVKSIDFDITFSLTQFDEKNVEKFIKEKKLKNFYINIPKRDLPLNKKYSNKLMHLMRKKTFYIYFSQQILINLY